MTTPTLCPTCQTPDWRVQYTATSLQGMLCTLYRCVAGHEWWHTVDPAGSAINRAAMVEKIGWALCADSQGAGKKGGCDLSVCSCGSEARIAVEAIFGPAQPRDFRAELDALVRDAAEAGHVLTLPPGVIAVDDGTGRNR